MATVNGFTAAHMAAIEDNTIVSGAVVANHLILTRFDGTTIDVGNIVGLGVDGYITFPNTKIGQVLTTPEGVETDSPGGLRLSRAGQLWLKVTGTGNTGWAQVATASATGLGVIVCTSSTRPSSPTVGQPIYETDTGKELFYYGATTGWQKAWDSPWGLLAQPVTDTTVRTYGTTALDLTGLSITYNAVLNRLYRLRLIASVNNSAAGANEFIIEAHSGTSGSGIVRGTFQAPLVAAGQSVAYTGEILFSPAATGSASVHCRFGYIAANSVVFQNAARSACKLILEDIGPGTFTVPSP